MGTDSVAQARNFNAAFGSARKLDGFIISKCDTVGDMASNLFPGNPYITNIYQIGTLVSMVHASGTPVLFIGTCDLNSSLTTHGILIFLIGVGQHYSDIRSLNVKWAVDKLLSPV